MFWHPESEAVRINKIFRITAKKAALDSVWQWAAGTEQSKQAEECNIFVYGSSHLSAISLKGADRSEYCFGALITNMPACAPTFCTNAKRSAHARKSLFRSRWHLEIYVSSLLPANVHCGHPMRTHPLSLSQFSKKLRHSTLA